MKQNLIPKSILFLFFASAIVVFCIALSTRQMMLESARMIEDNMKQEMAALSYAASLLVSAEELDAFMTVADMKKPEYTEIKRKLHVFSEKYGAQFTFFMRLDPGTNKMQFIVDNVLDPAEADGLDSPQVPREPGPDIALSGKPNVVDFGSYSDGWDGLITAWQPVSYRDGSLSNMVAGVDMQDVFIKRNRTNTRLLSGVLLAALVVVAILGFACMFLYRRKAQQAMQASLAKSSFLSRMSHEMRTPLNAVMGLSDMALEASTLEEARTHLGNILTSSRHLRNLIDDILDMAKIESGKMRLETALMNVDAELATIRSMIEPQINARGLRFVMERDPAVPRNLCCDIVHMRQIVVNLLSNAVKFTPEGGEVHLSVRLLERDGKRCNLEWRVRDTGIGIKADKLDTLFKPFVQADDSTTRKYGGTGLGLAISKQLAKMLHGDIKAVSESGKGSEFIFNAWVEAAPDDAVLVEEALQGEQKPKIDLTGKTLLLVEDTAINQMIAVSLFEKYGAAVVTADDGRQGLAAFTADSGRYSMIFMDIQMPEMDGYTCAAAIRSSGLSEAASVPIVAMTANVFKEDVDRALASGMDAHLKKPLEPEEIERTIALLLPDAALI